MLFPLETSIPTAFILLLLVIGYGFPPFTHCLFNLLGDTSAHGGSACANRMLRMRAAADGLHYGRVGPGLNMSCHLPSHSNSFGFEMEKDAAGCRALNRNYYCRMVDPVSEFNCSALYMVSFLLTLIVADVFMPPSVLTVGATLAFVFSYRQWYEK